MVSLFVCLISVWICLGWEGIKRQTYRFTVDVTTLDVKAVGGKLACHIDIIGNDQIVEENLV